MTWLAGFKGFATRRKTREMFLLAAMTDFSNSVLASRVVAFYVNSGEKVVENERFENGHFVGWDRMVRPRGSKPAGVLAAVKARPLGVRASGIL